VTIFRSRNINAPRSTSWPHGSVGSWWSGVKKTRFMESRIWFASKPASLLSCLVLALFLATLTLWVPSYWPVAAFEIAVFVIAGVAIVLARQPAAGAGFPLIVLSSIVLWGCLQLLTGSSINRFETERATLQWMTWAAVYYLGYLP
jgi:hypothetical protein